MYTIFIRPRSSLKAVEEEIDLYMNREKKYSVIYPYITHYMYDMQKRMYSATVKYFAIARHPNRK